MDFLQRDDKPLTICLLADARAIHTQRWAEYFAQHGHNVHLITYDSSGLKIKGVFEHVIQPRWKNHLYLSFFPRQRTINQILDKIKPDLVHAHFIAKYGFHLLFIGNYPKIVSAWGDDITYLPKASKLLFVFTRFVLNSVDIIYAVSHDIRNSIIQDYAISESKVHYLPFGVDVELFSPPRDSCTPEKKTIIIYSNRGFLPLYGMETIVKGFSLAIRQNPNLRLILKGEEGSDKEKIRKEIIRLELESTVTILNKTLHNDVSQELKNADIFITASIRDGTPVSLLEAMATGLPCVATSVGGVPEWIFDDVNGFLIPPNDPDIISRKILLLAEDAEKRKRLGSHARNTILERGNWVTLMGMAGSDYHKLVKPSELIKKE